MNYKQKYNKLPQTVRMFLLALLSSHQVRTHFNKLIIKAASDLYNTTTLGNQVTNYFRHSDHQNTKAQIWKLKAT